MFSVPNHCETEAVFWMTFLVSATCIKKKKKKQTSMLNFWLLGEEVFSLCFLFPPVFQSMTVLVYISSLFHGLFKQKHWNLSAMNLTVPSALDNLSLY